MKLDYETGSEVYSIMPDSKGDILLEESITTVQDFLSHRNPEKYADFVKGLDDIEGVLKIMGVPDYKKRVDLLKYMYYAMRLLDDICDGDTLEEFQLKERKSIIEGKLNNGLYDQLIEKVKEISSELGVLDGMQYAIDEIVGSMKFDVYRIMDDNKYRSREELNANFHRMDITGTIYGTAIIFGLNPDEAVHRLGGLGEATRIAYNLQDLQEDIIEGLINIPIEDLQKYGISEECLNQLKKGSIPQNVQKWIDGEIKKIHFLLNEYSENFSIINMIKNLGINGSFKMNYFRKLSNNCILRFGVMKKGYINEINDIIGSYV